jgi:hypothetical protein
VFGRKEDDEQLLREISGGNSVLLFPSEDAYDVDGLKKLGVTCRLATENCEATSGGFPGTTLTNEVEASLSSKTLRIVVLDGTWTKVKAMRKHLHRIGVRLPEVGLDPRSLDYWDKKGGVSQYTRGKAAREHGDDRDRPSDRISTVEAVALLLREFDEAEENCDAIIELVRVNNIGLQQYNQAPKPPKPTVHVPRSTSPNGT